MTRKGGSMSSNNTSAGSGILTVILVVLVTLKLTGTPPVAQWSWWWVLAPFWAPALALTGLLSIATGWRSHRRLVALERRG